MLNLMKYEWIRSKKFIAGYLVLLLFLECVMIFSLYKGDGYTLLFSLIMFFLLPGSFLIILIDGARMISADLNQTSGYMLFLTPNSGYRIIFSKLAVSAINFFISQLIVLFIYYTNYKLSVDLFLNEVSGIFLILINAFKELITYYIPSPLIVFLAFLSFMLSWFSTIVLVYLSIILTKTLFSRIRFKGLISFLFFILLSSLQSYITNALLFLLGRGFELSSYFTSALEETNASATADYLSFVYQYLIFSALVPLLFGILFTFLSGFLMEKRMDL